MLLKKCLQCKKLLFKKYDEVKYTALDNNNQPKEFTAYLCKKCADELDNEDEEPNYYEQSV